MIGEKEVVRPINAELIKDARLSPDAVAGAIFTVLEGGKTFTCEGVYNLNHFVPQKNGRFKLVSQILTPAIRVECDGAKPVLWRVQSAQLVITLLSKEEQAMADVTDRATLRDNAEKNQNKLTTAAKRRQRADRANAKLHNEAVARQESQGINPFALIDYDELCDAVVVNGSGSQKARRLERMRDTLGAIKRGETISIAQCETFLEHLKLQKSLTEDNAAGYDPEMVKTLCDSLDESMGLVVAYVEQRKAATSVRTANKAAAVAAANRPEIEPVVAEVSK